MPETLTSTLRWPSFGNADSRLFLPYCTMSQHWMNHESSPMSYLCVNIQSCFLLPRFCSNDCVINEKSCRSLFKLSRTLNVPKLPNLFWRPPPPSSLLFYAYPRLFSFGLKKQEREGNHSLLVQSLWITGVTDMRRLTTGIRSEKYIVRRFGRCAKVIECTYTNLDSITY